MKVLDNFPHLWNFWCLKAPIILHVRGLWNIKTWCTLTCKVINFWILSNDINSCRFQLFIRVTFICCSLSFLFRLVSLKCPLIECRYSEKKDIIHQPDNATTEMEKYQKHMRIICEYLYWNSLKIVWNLLLTYRLYRLHRTA